MNCMTWILLVATLALPAVSGAQDATQQRSRIPLEGSPSTGPVDAPVTIVEFIDFQSPHCQSAAPILRRVMETYPGKLRLVVKNLPLLNRDSHIAAKAALAAAAQGKYWEMHDLLLAPGAQFDREGLVRMAARLGLDAARFAADIDGVRYIERLEQDKALALALGVFETPTFYVNGRGVIGSRDFASLKAALDEELVRTQR